MLVTFTITITTNLHQHDHRPECIMTNSTGFNSRICFILQKE